MDKDEVGFAQLSRWMASDGYVEGWILGHMKVDTFGALDFASRRQENHRERQPLFASPKTKDKG